MYKLASLFIILIGIKSCSQLKVEKLDSLTVKYSAITRGSSYQCTISKKQIRVETMGVEDANELSELTNAHWDELRNLIEGIDLDNMHSWDAPSSNSSSDRARISNILIGYNGKTYESSSFDEDNPPKKLIPLIAYIITLAKTVE